MSEEVRININTKRMNDQLVPTKIPFPTPEELRHRLHGSGRLTVVDCKDSYFHFGLDEEAQEYLKFHGNDGVYWFKVLVMGTPSASGECYAAMLNILHGVKGVLQIKDNINIRREKFSVNVVRAYLHKERDVPGQRSNISRPGPRPRARER